MRRGLALGLAVALAGCAGGGALAPPDPQPASGAAGSWVLFTMDQQPGGGYAEYLWKPVTVYESAEACRLVLRARADRGPLAPVGLIAWYQLPGQPGHWVGCLPFGYDPYERR